MEVNASAKAQFWNSFSRPITPFVASTPKTGCMTNENTKDAAMKPRMNFGKRCQISPTPGRPPPSAVVAEPEREKKIAMPRATKPMRMFWIILTSAATCPPTSPRACPASTTAPVESTVPPIHAPPIIGST